MNVFWVFIPGIVLLALGLLIFEWRHRREQVFSKPPLTERASDESRSQSGIK